MTEFAMIMCLTLFEQRGGGRGEFVELLTLTAFGIWSTYCGLMIAFGKRKEDYFFFCIVRAVGFFLHC